MELSERARQLRNQYQRRYRLKNPDKIQEYNRRYWEKKAQQITPEQEARELKAQGWTQREIAEQLDISLGSVNKYLNKQ